MIEQENNYDNMIEKIKLFLVDNAGSNIDDIIIGVNEVSNYYKYPKTGLSLTLNSYRNKDWIARGKDLDRDYNVYYLLSDFDL